MIYTKTGDAGTTSLVGGKRVAKSELKIDCYGTIDELNSFIGLLLCDMNYQEGKKLLERVQNALFLVGSYLATDEEKKELRESFLIPRSFITELEELINCLEEELPCMHSFILPGGAKSASLAHVCRTICRRSERLICRLAKKEQIASEIGQFINRLSDLFFVIARKECLLSGKEEICWEKIGL